MIGIIPSGANVQNFYNSKSRRCQFSKLFFEAMGATTIFPSLSGVKVTFLLNVVQHFLAMPFTAQMTLTWFLFFWYFFPLWVVATKNKDLTFY